MRTTFVVIGSDTPLDRERLPSLDGGDGESLLDNLLLTDADLDALLAEREQVVLTDRYAPVDQMLAAVFLDRKPGE